MSKVSQLSRRTGVNGLLLGTLVVLSFATCLVCCVCSQRYPPLTAASRQGETYQERIWWYHMLLCPRSRTHWQPSCRESDNRASLRPNWRRVYRYHWNGNIFRNREILAMGQSGEQILIIHWFTMLTRSRFFRHLWQCPHSFLWKFWCNCSDGWDHVWYLLNTTVVWSVLSQSRMSSLTSRRNDTTYHRGVLE